LILASRKRFKASDIEYGILLFVENKKETKTMSDKSNYSTEPQDIKAFAAMIRKIATEIYERTVPNCVKRRRNADKRKLCDADIISLVIIGELLGMDSERCWFGFAKRNLGEVFGLFCDRTRYNRTKRALIHITGDIQRYLLERLPTARVGIIDSCPLPVCEFGRAHFHKSYKGYGAAYGCCVSKKETYYGYKMHLVIDENGLPVAFELTGANIDDRAVAEELSIQAGLELLLGDKGYVGTKLSNTTLIALDRNNAKHPKTRELRQLIFKKRRRIETTISQLTDTLHLQKVRARSFWGLCANIRLKILAFLTAVYINCLNGAENILAIKQLIFY